MGAHQEGERTRAGKSDALRKRQRAARAGRCAAQSGRGRGRALGEARAGRRAGARGPGGGRGDDRESALRRAHGQPRRAWAVLSEAGRCAEAALRRVALLLLHRRPAPAEADPPRALGTYAAVERGARVPALPVRDCFRSSHAGFPPVTRGPYAYLRRGTRVPGACTGVPQLRPSLRIRLSASNGALTLTSLSK